MSYAGVHIIPAFHWGRTTSLLPPLIARHKSENNEDWYWYYVNIFVDRDMFMRFQGGARNHLLWNVKGEIIQNTEDSDMDELMDESIGAEEADGNDSEDDSASSEGSTHEEHTRRLIPDTLVDEMDEYG
ncbi:hypothetical protein F5J12DRAFT_891833 [Pisolithus orientalis]|uniref:uncharacterized protein n=1 Tax=Pisolithus orientalis TaxID=936130 RepID=UPI0022252BE2|nr:uncharacterized protein F5J12DRAFT_891833 [Pisolithus orientalis]KAI6008697.1 hypothetical protein F5J12DRAFT_891833 [Pisolithus orientalis]